MGVPKPRSKKLLGTASSETRTKGGIAQNVGKQDTLKQSVVEGGALV